MRVCEGEGGGEGGPVWVDGGVLSVWLGFGLYGVEQSLSGSRLLVGRGLNARQGKERPKV